jgi:hypothetical protein
MRMVRRRNVSLCNALWLLLLLLMIVTNDSLFALASESAATAAAATSETELSTLIRAQEWSLALQHLEGHPEQARVWVERRGAHGKLVVQKLPLHLVFENPKEEEEEEHF